MRQRWISVGAALLLGALLAACGNGDAESDGEQIVEISAYDDLRFEPDAVTVQAGESVTFVVTNEGQVVHEFVLGPEHVQMAHEDASEGGEEHGGMEVEGQLAALTVDPGEKEQATVTFDEPGEMPYGCHEPGHYDGGMVGTVTIE